MGRSRVGSGEVEVIYPQQQLARVDVRVAVDGDLRPPAQQGLDEMLILVIGVRRVWARADLPVTHAEQQLGEAP